MLDSNIIKIKPTTYMPSDTAEDIKTENASSELIAEKQPTADAEAHHHFSLSDNYLSGTQSMRTHSYPSDYFSMHTIEPSAMHPRFYSNPELNSYLGLFNFHHPNRTEGPSSAPVTFENHQYDISYYQDNHNFDTQYKLNKDVPNKSFNSVTHSKSTDDPLHIHLKQKSPSHASLSPSELSYSSKSYSSNTSPIVGHFNSSEIAPKPSKNPTSLQPKAPRRNSMRGEQTKHMKYTESFKIAQKLKDMPFEEVVELMKDKKKFYSTFSIDSPKDYFDEDQNLPLDILEVKRKYRSKVTLEFEESGHAIARKSRDVLAMVFLMSVLTPVFISSTSELYHNYTRTCNKHHSKPLSHALFGKVLKFLRPNIKKNKKIHNGKDSLFYFSSIKGTVEPPEITKKIEEYIKTRMHEKTDLNNLYTESEITDNGDTVDEESIIAKESPEIISGSDITLPSADMNKLFKFTPPRKFVTNSIIEPEREYFIATEVLTYRLGPDSQEFSYINLDPKEIIINIPYNFQLPEFSCPTNSNFISVIEFVSVYTRFCENRLHALLRFQNKRYFQEIVKINDILSYMKVDLLFKGGNSKDLINWVSKCDEVFYKTAISKLLELLHCSLPNAVIFQLFIMGRQMSDNSRLKHLPNNLLSLQEKFNGALENIIRQLVYIFGAADPLKKTLFPERISIDEEIDFYNFGCKNLEEITNEFLKNFNSYRVGELKHNIMVFCYSMRASRSSTETLFLVLIKFVTSQTLLLHDCFSKNLQNNPEEMKDQVISDLILSILLDVIYGTQPKSIPPDQLNIIKVDLRFLVLDVVRLALSCRPYLLY